MISIKKKYLIISILFFCFASLEFLRDYWYFFSLNREFPFLKNLIYFYSHIPFWLLTYPLLEKIATSISLVKFDLVAFLWRMLVLYLIAVIVYALHYTLATFLQELANITRDGAFKNYGTFQLVYFGSGLSTFFMFVFIVVCLNGFRYLNQFQEERERSLMLENQLSFSEIETLKMQLHPHFLFNTLNSLSSLVEEKSENAAKMIINLADFLRYSIDYQNKNVVLLNQELDFVKNYLAIETIRYKNRLNIDYQIDPNSLKINVPTFILQPLIENAIKHGVNRFSSNTTIVLSISKLNNNDLEIRVRNQSPIENQEIKFGLGLSNLNLRLKQLYGKNYSLSLNQGEQFFICQIILGELNGPY